MRPNEAQLRRLVPALDLSAAASGLPPASLIPDEEAAIDPLAYLYVPEEGGAIRTLIGAAHRHWYSLIPSEKTGGWQPVESEGEEMLAYDSEADFAVLSYQTQGARLRAVGSDGPFEWIIDQLRQLRDGTVEAIEVKPCPEALDAETRLAMIGSARILGRLGWRVRVRYHEEIRGCPARQINRALAFCDADVRPCGDSLAAFDRLRVAEPRTTLGRLWSELPVGRHHAEAMARSLMVAGRIEYDIDAHLHAGSVIVLHDVPSFVNKIDFAAR